CRLATPITIKFEQLQSREGYDPQKESANFGPLWRGGEWHIRDITNTMTTVAFFLLKHAAQNREHWLQRFYEIEKAAVRPRKKGELLGFLFDGFSVGGQRLTDVLKTAEVETIQTSRGEFVRLDQPYGSFAKAVTERQHYPDL